MRTGFDSFDVRTGLRELSPRRARPPRRAEIGAGPTGLSADVLEGQIPGRSSRTGWMFGPWASSQFPLVLPVIAPQVGAIEPRPSPERLYNDTGFG